MNARKLNILVATDLTEVSSSALVFAVNLAKPLDAILTLLHVVEPVGGDTVFVAQYDKIIEEARDSLHTLRQSMDLKEEQCQIEVQVGFPSERILKLVEANGISIVVMGMQRDLATLDREVFGSNAYDVIKRGICPVIVVPEGTGESKLKNLVLAVALDMKENVYLLSLIRRIAMYNNSKITLLHVAHGDHLVVDGTSSRAIHWVKEQLKDCDATFTTLYSKKTAEAILLYIEENPADLLIMSPETQGMIERFFKGSTTRKTLMHSQVPMLAFPADYL